MKHWLIYGAMMAGAALGTPAEAQISINFSIPLPPCITFSEPPQVVVIPQTQVYVVPEAQEDMYFYNGWWYRPWNGRWYRSQNYERGWVCYQSVPTFYHSVPRHWRDCYRTRQWCGRPWQHREIQYHDLNRNWREWHRTRYWDQPRHRQYQESRPTRWHDNGQQHERSPRWERQERDSRPHRERPEQRPERPWHEHHRDRDSRDEGRSEDWSRQRR